MTKLIILSYQSEQRKVLALTNPSIQFQLDNFKIARLPTKSVKKKFAFSITTRYFDCVLKHFNFSLG